MKRILVAAAIWLTGIALIFGAAQAIQKAHAQPGIAPNPDLLSACNQVVIYDGSTSGESELIPGVTGKNIYLCGFTLWSAGTVTVSIVWGTGSSCTGANKLTPAYQFTAQTGIVDHLPVYEGIGGIPSPNNICLNTSAGVAVQAMVYYAQW